MNALDIRVPPWNTTLMGAVRGAADFYGVEFSDAMAYGATGHAFLLHIHPELCPSGPYTWKREVFIRLLHNLGLTFEHLGFFDPHSPAESRRRLEQRVRDELGESRPCAVCNMEWQLIVGCDEAGFDATAPWRDHLATTPPRLTAGSWQEFGKEIHADFYAILRTPRGTTRHTIAQALFEVNEIYKHSDQYAAPGYVMGLNAYRLWREAIPQFGDSHGNWWNACVWSECRMRAGEFMREVAHRLGEPSAEECGNLYSEIGHVLGKVADKEASHDAKIAALAQCEEIERLCVDKIDRLASSMVLYA